MHVASLWRRLLAFLLLQTMVWTTAMSLVLGVLPALLKVRRKSLVVIRRLGGHAGNGGTDDASLTNSSETKASFGQSTTARAAWRGALMTVSIGTRNVHAKPVLTLGLRRVDARTGGPVSRRSALLGEWFDQASQAIGVSLFKGRVRRDRDRLHAFMPQITEIRAQHADDDQKLEATKYFYKTFDIHPFRAMGWAVAGRMIPSLILALGFRDGRTVRDRVTGTSVILDR